MRDQDGKPRGVKPQHIKCEPKTKYSTPEEVAAYESMRNKPHDVHRKPKPKTLKHNTKKNTTANSMKQDDPIMRMDFKNKLKLPITDSYIYKLTMQLIDWVENRKQTVIDDFLQEVGMHPQTFSNLKEKYPDLKNAYEYAKMCVGNKREKEGLYNKMNANMVMRSMPAYSDQWKDLEEWRAALTKKDEDKQTIINLTIPDLVPKKAPSSPRLRRTSKKEVKPQNAISKKK